ncbi:unnamed protein product [Agarophyton chilense]
MDRPSEKKVVDSRLVNVLSFLVIAFIGLGYSLSTLPTFSPPPDGYSLSDRECIGGVLKFGLVATHILIFVLIPLAMKVFYTSLSALNLPQSSIFASQLGLAFIMVAIASEIGWHVTQCWYYVDEFTMLNFMFYFFLLSAFALWSDGLVESHTSTDTLLNVLFALSLFIVCLVYPAGSANGNSSYKTPIYIALTFIFAVLTYRGYKLLGSWRVLWFPFFSVGVNLFFVFLLQKYGGDPYTDPHKISNAVFHVAHDLLGTETGVVIFTVMVYLKGRQARKEAERAQLLPGLT